jgi:hypothetical protein
MANAASSTERRLIFEVEARDLGEAHHDRNPSDQSRGPPDSLSSRTGAVPVLHSGSVAQSLAGKFFRDNGELGKRGIAELR